MYAHYSGDIMLTNLKNIRFAVRFYLLRKSRLGYYEKSQTFQGYEAVKMSTYHGELCLRPPYHSPNMRSVQHHFESSLNTIDLLHLWRNPKT
jgi:hypothetical protein